MNDLLNTFLADTEIIDIKAQTPAARHQLESQWKAFVHNQYATFLADFWCSRIACSPRRTFEAQVASQLNLAFLEVRTPPREGAWDDFWRFYDPLIARERQ